MSMKIFKTHYRATVMPVVLLLAVLVSGCSFVSQKPKYPEPKGYVNDNADMISDAEEVQITEWIRNLNQKTGAEVVVLTVPKTSESLEEYAVTVFEKWGIGKKGEDNGVLLLVAPENPQGRKIRIEVGYGLEGALTDQEAGMIITDRMTPYCKVKQFNECLREGVRSIISQVAPEYDLAMNAAGELVPADQVPQEQGTEQATQTYRTDSGDQDYETGSRSSSRPVSGFQKLTRSIGGIIFLVIMVVLFIMNPRLFLLMLFMRGGGGGWSSGRGGFGGGFGGFGGGMSGGGGASGGW